MSMKSLQIDSIILNLSEKYMFRPTNDWIFWPSNTKNEGGNALIIMNRARTNAIKVL